MISLVPIAVAGCLAVSAGSDQITLGDLARALGLPAVAQSETPISFAPMPGLQRIFHVPELRRLSARWNLPGTPDREICFERPTSPADPAAMLQAMRKKLPHARIEILDYSRIPVPQGDMDFPETGLRQASAGGFWNGFVRYAENRRYPIWAKVQVSITATRVVAATDLKAGRAINPSELRVETRDEFPATTPLPVSIEEAAGRVLRRTVPAGTVMRFEWLEEARDVSRGDRVQVEVWNGAAHLQLEAEAAASGSVGQVIAVRNPASNKIFMARVEGKGRVTIRGSGL